MKILHIITSLSTGGAEAMLYKLLGGMDSDEFEQTVVVLMESDVFGRRLRSQNVPVIALGMKQGRPSIGSILMLKRVIENVQPAFIQGWMYHGNLAAEIGKTISITAAETFWNIRHSIKFLQEEKLLTRSIIRISATLSSRPRKIIYNSRASAAQHENIGYSAAESVVIPNGFDTEVYRYSDSGRLRIRFELKIDDDQFLVGTVARHHPIKDLKNLIHSAILLSNQHTNLRFVLVGPGVDSSQSDILKEISNAGLQSRFRLLGDRNDIPAIMSALDLFVLPSRSEGFPNAIGEAMACERPCIATDVGDCAVLLGASGVLVPPRSSKALADAIVQMSTTPGFKRMSIGRMLRQRIEENYSLSSIIDLYQDLYRSVPRPGH